MTALMCTRPYQVRCAEIWGGTVSRQDEVQLLASVPQFIPVRAAGIKGATSTTSACARMIR